MNWEVVWDDTKKNLLYIVYDIKLTFWWLRRMFLRNVVCRIRGHRPEWRLLCWAGPDGVGTWKRYQVCSRCEEVLS